MVSELMLRVHPAPDLVRRPRRIRPLRRTYPPLDDIEVVTVTGTTREERLRLRMVSDDNGDATQVTCRHSLTFRPVRPWGTPRPGRAILVLRRHGVHHS
ncbi:hypothetical protein ACWDE9_40180 [Streptomyces olivaceoviridis]